MTSSFARNAIVLGLLSAIGPFAIDMYLPALPPVDVVVRTSGERRISNFMLWQSAGSPVYFTEQTWPDFGAAELDAAIAVARE